MLGLLNDHYTTWTKASCSWGDQLRSQDVGCWRTIDQNDLREKLKCSNVHVAASRLAFVAANLRKCHVSHFKRVGRHRRTPLEKDSCKSSRPWIEPRWYPWWRFRKRRKQRMLHFILKVDSSNSSTATLLSRPSRKTKSLQNTQKTQNQYAYWSFTKLSIWKAKYQIHACHWQHFNRGLRGWWRISLANEDKNGLSITGETSSPSVRTAAATVWLSRKDITT